MKLVVEIPEEFECDWYTDEFQDCFERVLADLRNSSCVSGNYEKETIEMLEGAFRDAKECEPKDSKEDVLDRYLILLGPNTRQWWVYDEIHDCYIDPPADVLREIQDDRSFTRVNGVLKDAFESEEAKLRHIVSKDPDWLNDTDHWYSDIEI
jgi:hypothetical protein